MSGRDEQPNVYLSCPKCKDFTSRNTEKWSIFIIREFNSLKVGVYYTEGDFLRNYFNGFVGEKVYSIKCDCPILSYEYRHEYYAGDKIFEDVMKKMGFADGVINER